MEKIEVKLESISKKLGDFYLEDINLKANPKEIIGIIGENGAGKTTLLKIISRLIGSDSGKILIPEKENVGIVFDSNHLPEELNYSEINMIMAQIFSNWDSIVFLNYMDEFNLPRNKSIKNFSKGMQTKLSIAVSLSHKPQLLLLDEMTSGLDPLIKGEILEIIKEYINNNEAIAIMTTHILDDIIKIADKVIVLSKGKVLLNKDAREFKNTETLEKKLKEIIN